MTRVTFGAAASSCAANMAVKQNAVDLTLEFPSAAKAVDQSFYVDDGLTGADSVDVPDDLKESQSLCTLPEAAEYAKTLGIEWNTVNR